MAVIIRMLGSLGMAFEWLASRLMFVVKVVLVVLVLFTAFRMNREGRLEGCLSGERAARHGLACSEDRKPQVLRH